MTNITAPSSIDRAEPTAEPAELELSVVMPCLNEVRTVGVCVKKAMETIRTNGLSAEVIVADNGSTDGSQALAEALGARVVPVPARGYGAALAAGIAAARGRFVIMADSDDSYDLTNLMPFVEKLREGYDLVMGNRFKGGILKNAMPPLHRYFGNPGLTMLGRLFFRSNCGDFYCGQRGFQRDAIRKLDLHTTGMEFALEMLVKSTITGLKVTEVPVKLQPDGRDRPPHLRSWRDGWRSLRFYLLYSPRWLFLYPGTILMLLGLVFGALLLPGPRNIFGVTLDVHTLAYCAAAIIVGFQLVAFAVYGKILAVSSGLHPPNPRLDRFVKKLPIEYGLIGGALMVLVGIGLSIFAVVGWAGAGFSNLDPFVIMRLVIPAMLLLTLGCQVVFSSFYFGLLQIQCQRLGMHE